MGQTRPESEAALISARDPLAYARRLGIFAYIGAGIAAIVAIEQLSQEKWALAIVNGSFAFVLLAIRAWGVRGEGRLPIAANLAIAAGVLDILLTAIVQWETNTLGLWALAIVPLVAGYLLGVRAAVVWTAVSLAVLGVVHGVAYAQDVDLAINSSPLTTLFFQVVIVVGVFAFAIAGRRISDRQYSELKERELRLEEYANQLEAASAARSEFMSHMSHELRTPLNVMMGFAQMLHQRADDPGNREQLAHIIDAGQHLLKLINEALEIDSLEEGRVELDLRAVRLEAVIDDAAGFIEPAAEETGITVQVVDPIGDDHPIVRADPARLSQAVLNLLSNAVTRNKTGTRIRISTRVDGESALLAIVDSGPGLTPEEVKSLFVPFESPDESTTGVGVFVSRALVEAMGGEIDVEGKKGQGTTINVSLPIADLDRDELVVDTEAVTAAVDQAPATGSLLYIEDNPKNVTLFEAIARQRPLVDLGVARGGEDGIKRACREHPDLIVLDLHLPDIDGVKVLRRLHSDPRTSEIPVIVLSADATDNAISAATDAGACAYLTKPLEISSVLRALDAHLGNGGGGTDL